LAETCGSKKLSDFLEGLGGWNETDSLFPLGAKPVLPLGQVKAKVLMVSWQIWAFLQETLCPASHKRERRM
jgi:hypothetical protein